MNSERMQSNSRHLQSETGIKDSFLFCSFWAVDWITKFCQVRRKKQKMNTVPVWQVHQRSDDSFILKRDRDKHYLRAASTSAAADLLHTIKTVSVHQVCTDLSWGKFLSTTVPLRQTVVVSVGSYDDIFVCFYNGKIPLSWTHAQAARLKAQLWRGEGSGWRMENTGEIDLVDGKNCQGQDCTKTDH